MTTNKDIILKYSETVWQNHDLSAIDTMVAPKAKIHSPLSTVQGNETMKEIMEKWLTAFPDLTVIWEDFIAEDDKVVSRWRARGTHLGGFFDTKPTHKEIAYTGVTTYRLVDGKIVEYWALVDMHSILTQLEEYKSVAEALE